MSTNENKYSVCEYFPKRYVVFDLEATGTSEFNYIIDISAFKIENGEVIDEFSTLVKPPKYRLFSKRRRKVQSFCRIGEKKIYYVDKFIENLTGINNKMIHNAEKESVAIRGFYDFIGENVLVGHGVGNDLILINKTFKRVLKKDLKNQYLDTFSMALFLYDKDYSLVNLCKKFNIENVDIHRARSDAYRTFLCYEKLIDEINKNYERNKVCDEFTKWNFIRQSRQTKILKNKMMRNINKKNWNHLKKLLDNNLYAEDIFSEKNIYMSKKISTSDLNFISSKINHFGFHIFSKLGIKTDYYITSGEISESNINLENKILRKIVNMNKKGNEIRIVSCNDLINTLKRKCDNNAILANNIDYGIQFKGKNFYVYNDFSFKSKQDIENDIRSRGGKIFGKLSRKVDYILVGEGLDREIFHDSKEFDILIALLSFGCDILIYNENYYKKIVCENILD